MKILVTGGAGFIGSHNAKRLLEKGHDVVIIDDFNEYYDSRLKRGRIKYLLSGMDFKLYESDIADFKNLREVFKKNDIDIVIHQAAQAGVRYSLEDPFTYEKTNIKGTLNLLECCKEFEIKKLIFASSASVYGNNKKLPFSEEDKTDTQMSFYAATKKATESICYSYHSLYKIPMVGLRYFMVYGPWGRPDAALFKFTKNILGNKPIDVYGQGEMERSFTYIDDIIDGIMSALEKNFDFEIFNLGGKEMVRLMKFIEILEKCLNKKAKKNFLPIQKGEVFAACADTSKAKKMLGWKPKIPIDKGIENFVHWYKNYYK